MRVPSATVKAFRTGLFRLYGNDVVRLILDVFMGEKTYREIFQNPFNYLKLLRFWKLKLKEEKSAA